jgi:hypothetical protein
VLHLSSLEALGSGPPAGGAPLGTEAPIGLAATPEGIVLGFPDRTLSLGPLFQIDWRTMRDLAMVRPPAETDPITHFSLSPLGEVILFEAGSGAVVFLHPLTGERRRYASGVTYPTRFVGLAGGGFALLKGERLLLFRRRAGVLERRDIALPRGMYPTLAAHPDGNLWVFDWLRRRVVVFNPGGDIVDSIVLGLDAPALLLPQVLEPCADGGFLLGGSGELWRFSHDGAPLWKMDGLELASREALPPVFELAAVPGASSFYLLDPPSGRVFRFQEQPPEGLEARLAGGLGPGTARGDSDVRFLLEGGLHLLAVPLLGTAKGQAEREALARVFAHSLRLRRAQALDGLAGRLEEELLLAEAEQACAEGLELYRQLRAEDPVDGELPARIAGLTDRRARLREVLFEEPLLEADIGLELRMYREAPLTLVNRSAETLRDLEITLRICGLPAMAPLAAALESLAPGGLVTVPIAPRPERGRESFFRGLGEEVRARLAILILFRSRGEPRLNYDSRAVSLDLAGVPAERMGGNP